MKNLPFLDFMRMVKSYQKQAVSCEYRLGRYAMNLTPPATDNDFRFVEFYFTLQYHPQAYYFSALGEWVMYSDCGDRITDNLVIGVHGYLCENEIYRTGKSFKDGMHPLKKRILKTAGFEVPITNSGKMSLESVADKIRRYYPLTVDHWK